MGAGQEVPVLSHGPPPLPPPHPPVAIARSEGGAVEWREPCVRCSTAWHSEGPTSYTNAFRGPSSTLWVRRRKP